MSESKLSSTSNGLRKVSTISVSTKFNAKLRLFALGPINYLLHTDAP